jgi:predicted HAD superfamily phosphohydrolase
MTLLAAFAAAFVGVSLKAFQQLNVVRGRYGLVPLFSYGLAGAEVFIISQVATSGENMAGLIAAIGTGGWMGCFVSMWIDRRIRG